MSTSLAMKNYFLINILLVPLIFEASSDFTLTSDPSNLEGATICPGYVRLFCNATSIRTEFVTWFFHNGTVYATRRHRVNEVLPQIIPPRNSIPGVEIVLTKSSTDEYRYTSYESTLMINLTLFKNVRERLSFKCGISTQKSDSINLNFYVAAPRDPNLNQLIPVYNSSYLLTSVKVTWRQPIPELCARVFYYQIYIFAGRFVVENIVGANNCHNLICSTEFQIASIDRIRLEDIISAGLTSGDIYRHNSGNRFQIFQNTFNVSINPGLNYMITENTCNTRLHCSYFNKTGCQIQYSRNPSYENLGSPFDIPNNGLELHRRSTTSYFQITFDYNPGLKILYRGVLIKTELRAPPYPSYATCSLVRTTGGAEVSFRWSSTFFIPLYNIEMYHIIIESSRRTSATPCSYDQTIRSNERYRCSGLHLGTNYNFYVSAINCDGREGASNIFQIMLKAPTDARIFPVYGQNGRLSKVTVQWMRLARFSDKCSLNQLPDYRVVLHDNTRERVDQRMIRPDSCSSNNLCSISFPFSLSDQPDPSYSFRVDITGTFGSTSTSTSLDASKVPFSVDVPISSEGCVTSILCSYHMCFFQYGRDSSYQNLSLSLSISLNSLLQITVTDAATIHYYQMTYNTSIYVFQVRGNFTSGKAVQLTSANQGLVVVGVIALIFGAIILGVIITWMLINKGPWLSLGFSVTGLAVALLSLALWVAVGFHVGLQTNTCDPTWQSSRNGLISSAHVFSDINFLIAIGGLLVSAIHYKFKGKQSKKKDQVSSPPTSVDDLGKLGWRKTY